MTKKQKAFVYYLVAAYVLYLVFGIAKNKYLGDPTFSMPMAIGICCVMGILALMVIAYATAILIHEKREKEKKEIEESKE